MRTVLLIDTSIFLNVLDVPGFNQNRDEVLAEFAKIVIDQNVNLLLPIAAIIEAGNHIAHLTDGRVRRQFAMKLVKQVKQAIDGSAPWTPIQGLELTTLAAWLDDFPDHAMRRIGIADLSIIKEFEAACARHPRFRVKIWSLDGHLAGHDRVASTR